MTSKGSPETPSEDSSLTARPWNAVVAMRPAAVPLFASSMASWRLHDVHDPQSAEPAKTTSHSLLSSAITSGAAGVEALALRRCTTALTP
jgi:predicted component of type VI protein secretion system